MRKTIAASLLPCLLLAVVPAHAADAEQDGLPWEDARRFAEALEIIRTQYARATDDATLIDHAIRGMAEGVDPYSTYLTPDEFEQARISAAGRYEGIGVEVVPADDGYLVVAALSGGPADKAGILPGDILLRAAGKPLARVTPGELDLLMKGEIGSRVTVTIRRGEAPPFEVTIQRALVSIPSVSGEAMADGIAYLRVAHFSDRSAQELANVLDALDAPRGLVIDLRNNAGGVVDGAVEFADAFIDTGTIVSTWGRATGQTREYDAETGTLLRGVPMIVLVNTGTASAAEIVAGALQDHELAVVVGTPTFGKGAVQSLIPLDGGGALKLTTAAYLTPSGRDIDEHGIQPDVLAEEADETVGERPADDPVARRAAQMLRAMMDSENVAR